MSNVVGWDIGAANVKAVLISGDEKQTKRVRAASQPFEIWRERDRLGMVLRSVFDTITSGVSPAAMAVTMTAELSDVFNAKREGVLFILQSLRECFPSEAVWVFGLSGEFVSLDEAVTRPLEYAASNWLAFAQWFSRRIPDCLLIDVGSTTTDILPIVGGRVCVSGRTDLERLSSGELVYTGALRTNLAAIVHSVPVRGRLCRVASEYFSISGDVHLILGNLDPEDYTCPAPDAREPAIDSARRRLARLVCADAEMLSAEEINEIARYICGQQVLQIREGIEQVISRLPSLRMHPVVVFGSGSFLGLAAARDAGLEISEMMGDLGKEEMAVAPCTAVARLLDEHLRGEQ